MNTRSVQQVNFLIDINDFICPCRTNLIVNSSAKFVRLFFFQQLFLLVTCPFWWLLCGCCGSCRHSSRWIQVIFSNYDLMNKQKFDSSFFLEKSLVRCNFLYCNRKCWPITLFYFAVVIVPFVTMRFLPVAVAVACTDWQQVQTKLGALDYFQLHTGSHDDQQAALSEFLKQ